MELSAWLGGGQKLTTRNLKKANGTMQRPIMVLKVGSHWDGRNGTARPTAIAGWCGHEICLPILPERVLRGQTTSNFCHYNIYWNCGSRSRSWNFYLMDNVTGTYFRNFVWVNFLMGAL